MREVLLAALMERFASQRPHTVPPPGPVAVFLAKHPAIGEVTVRDTAMSGSFSVTVAIGDITASNFASFDSHLEPREREERITQEVVRFLQELFADRLLFWRSADGRNPGWRERGDSGYSEPLVVDNRVYHRYLWSGPLPTWQAIPAIVATGRIRDERDYGIVVALLNEPAPDLEPAELALARQLAAEYRTNLSEPG